MKNSLHLAAFLDYLKQVNKECNAAAQQEREADLAVQDILHRLELTDDGYHDSAKLALAIRKVRKERRKARDTRAILEPIIKWCTKNQAAIKQLESLLEEVRKTEKYQENRHYNERTDIVSITLDDIKKEQPKAAPSRANE